MSESILYHGSTSIIERPEFGKGNRNNDYGLGFYCTKDNELAKEWACSTRNGGFSNIYSIDLTKLNVMQLKSPEYGVLDWLSILVNNRVFSIDAPIVLEGKDYLTQYFLPNINSFDVIEGYRADDSYFTFAMDFLSNIISLRQLSRAMVLGYLGEQCVLKSKKAFEALKFLRSEPADGEIYFVKRIERDKAAREEYLTKERLSARQRNDIYMIDILREEMKRGDARLQ